MLEVLVAIILSKFQHHLNPLFSQSEENIGNS